MLAVQKYEDVGRISHPSSGIGVWWRIENLFHFLQNDKCSLDSSEFTYGDATWCLRLRYFLHSDGSVEKILLYPLKRNSRCTEHGLIFWIAVLRQDRSTFKDFVQEYTYSGKENLVWPPFLLVTDFEKKRDEIFPRDSLEVACSMYTTKCERQQTTVQINSSLENGKTDFLCTSDSGQQLEISEKEDQDVGQISVASGGITVYWYIDDIYNFTQNNDCSLDSPTFSYGDAAWYLRLRHFPQRNTSADKILLYLQNKHSNSAEHKLGFWVGIRRPDRSTYKDIILDYTFGGEERNVSCPAALSVTDFKKKRDEIVGDGVLIVVCSMITKNCKPVQESVETKVPSDSNHSSMKSEEICNSSETDSDSGEETSNEPTDSDHSSAKSEEICNSSETDCVSGKETSNESADVKKLVQNFNNLTLTEDGKGAKPKVPDRNRAESSTGIVKTLVSEQKPAPKVKALQFLMNNLSIDTFCDALSLSLKSNVSELPEKFVEFFAQNKQNITITSMWQSFVKKNPEKCNELLSEAAIYNEKHVLSIKRK